HQQPELRRDRRRLRSVRQRRPDRVGAVRAAAADRRLLEDLQPRRRKRVLRARGRRQTRRAVRRRADGARRHDLDPETQAMKKVWLAGAAFALATLAPNARADESDFPRAAKASPQWFAIEFRFAPYWPAIDTQPSLGGATPYHDIFGSMPRLLASFEIDAQLLKIPHFGSLGPAFSFGYTEMSAPAPITGGNGQVSAENTNIEVFPMYLAAVLRVD